MFASRRRPPNGCGSLAMRTNVAHSADHKLLTGLSFVSLEVRMRATFLCGGREVVGLDAIEPRKGDLRGSSTWRWQEANGEINVRVL